MTSFRDKYLSERKQDPLQILDLGSQDVNGTYRPLFSTLPWRYIGIDMALGENVDVVLHTPYDWKEIGSESVDVIISGQAFEHIQYFWITILEIARALKPGGILCILAPSSGPEHRYPMDCWRFYPDGMASLGYFAQLEVLEATTQWENKGYPDDSDCWHDSMLVCRKPNKGLFLNTKSNLIRWIQHKAITLGLQ